MTQGPWPNPTMLVWKVASSLGPGVLWVPAGGDLVELTDKLTTELEAAGGVDSQPGYGHPGCSLRFSFDLVEVEVEAFARLPAFNGFDQENAAAGGGGS